MERRSIEILSSSITIVLSIFTIAVFILYGGNLLSYLLIAIAIIFAMFNAWLISHEESESKIVRPQSRKKVPDRKRHSR